MLIFRSINQRDTKDIRQWCKDHNFELTNICLPKNGYIVENRSKKICCCWIYITSNSNIGWFAYPITNKNIDIKIRDKALDYMLSSISEEAKKLGNPLLLTTSGIEVVQKRLLKNGFMEADKNINQYIKGV